MDVRAKSIESANAFATEMIHLAGHALGSFNVRAGGFAGLQNSSWYWLIRRLPGSLRKLMTPPQRGKMTIATPTTSCGLC